MRILLITQNFIPEIGALSNRMYPIARTLAENGHEVTVVTGMPNYPSGNVSPKYIGSLECIESIGGCKVIRVAYITVPRNISATRQLISYISFMFAAFFGGLRAGKQDIVFVTSPPLFPAISAVYLARIWGVKLVCDLRDLWPDEIVACGAASENNVGVRILRGLERWIYRNSDLISCTTEAFIETIADRGVDRQKTVLVPNGADLSIFKPMTRDSSMSDKFGFDDKFVVVYAGLLGLKHGLETLIQAAEALKNDPRIRFCICGSGPVKSALMKIVEKLSLDNVQFIGELQVSDIPQLLARADLCYSGIRPEPYLNKIISAKLFEYMACSRPVVCSAGGESANLVNRSGCGISVPPGDAAALAEAIKNLSTDSATLKAMGESGHSFVTLHYSRSATARRLMESMVTLCNDKEVYRVEKRITADEQIVSGEDAVSL